MPWSFKHLSRSARELDAVLRARLTFLLTDTDDETDDSLLDLGIALEHVVTDFRKDRLSRKAGHGKPVNTPGNGVGNESAPGGGSGGPTPPAPVAVVTVAPSSFSLEQGQANLLTATLTDANGNVLTGRVTSWSSSDTSVATVTSAGLVTGVAAGTATITATSESINGTASATVTAAPVPPPPAVASVTVSPASFSKIVGETQQLTAVTKDGSGNVLTGRLVTWISNNPSVATVNASGLVTAVSAGSATITATSETIAGTSGATVTLVPVASVSVSPNTFALQINGTQQLTASPRDANGNALTGRSVSWSSSNTAVATVNSVGFVTAVGPGSVTITATSGSGTGASLGTVTAPITVSTVSVTPAPFSLTVGQTAQMTATARDSLGNTVTGRQVTWASTSPSVAAVSADGLVTAVSVGSTTIRATVDGISGTSAGTITAVPVASVSVSPSSFSIQATTTRQLTATCHDASNNVLSGRVVTWSSSNNSVATVSSTGLVTGVAAGSATITATSEGVPGTSAATITAAPSPTITNVTVAPNVWTVVNGATQQLTATATDSTGATVSTTVAWSSNNPTVATVSNTGLVTTISTGAVTISATAGGIVGTSTGTVSAVPVSTVTVSPSTFSKTVGQTQQLTATLRDASNNILTGRAVTWTTSNGSIASVTSAGLVTAVSAGSVTITATSESKSGTSAGTISAAPPAAVASVTVSPSSFSKAVGSTQSLTATVKDAGNNILTGRTVTWASSSPSVATVTSPGQTATVTAVAAGSATITATCETVPGTSAATITLVPVAQVVVSPSTFSVSVGATQQLTATTKDASGNTLTGRTVTWSSSSNATATVSSTGLVTGVGAGSVVITATSETIQGTSAGTVPGGGNTNFSALNAPSTVRYNPRPHPAVGTPGYAVAATFPQTFLDSRYGFDVAGVAVTYGTTVTVTVTGNVTTDTNALQAALTAAKTRSGNTDIVISGDDGVFNQPQIPTHTAGAFHTRIRWAGLAVAEGTRATPSDMTHAPLFKAPSPSTHAVKFDRSANNTRFVGIKFGAASGSPSTVVFDLVFVAPKEGDTEFVTDVSTIPDQIGFDRCLMEGNDHGNGVDTGNVRNGLTLNAKRSFLVDSYIHQVGWTGNESHGCIVYNTPGPLKFVNNFIEGTSACLFFGGAVPSYGAANGRPTDIEIRRNHLTRRLEWARDGDDWDGVGPRGVKNSFESKNTLRTLVEGNVIEHSWADGQTGMIVVVKSAAGGFSAAGCGTTDMTIRYNVVRGGTRCWNFAALSDEQNAIRATRAACYHNLSYDIGDFQGQQDGLAFLFLNNYDDLYFANNTVAVNMEPSQAFQIVNARSPLSQRFQCVDNVIGFEYLFCDGSVGTAALNAWAAAGWVFARNVCYMVDNVPAHPQATNQYPAHIANVGFTSIVGDDYTLAVSSTFKGDGLNGADPGCDVATVNVATGGVS